MEQIRALDLQSVMIHAADLRQAGKTDEACSLLVGATMNFPGAAAPWQALGRLAETLKHWAEAEPCWRRAIALDDSFWWAHQSLGAALRQQNRPSEAEAVLAAALDRFPEQAAEFAIDLAAMAETRGDWAEALRYWRLVHARLPNDWPAQASLARALQRRNRWDEAEALLRGATEQFPGEFGAWHDFGRLEELRGRWTVAEGCWRRAIFLNDGLWWVHVALAATLRQQKRWPAAKTVLAGAQDRFPEDRVAFDSGRALIAEASGDLTGALRQWEALETRFPDLCDGYAGRTRVLRELGRFPEAEAVIAAGQDRLPAAVELAVEAALNAIVQEDWKLAYARLKSANERFPDSDKIQQRFYDVRLRLLESEAPLFRGDDELRASAMPDSADQNIGRAELAAHFESLGGGVAEEGAWAFGCEFGFFQRHVGAEPISLLRWASIAPTSLAMALENRFDGIDAADELVMREDQGATDWAFTQNRYQLRVDHTNLPLARISRTEAHRRLCRLLGYLSEKLIRDLENDEKIFVYRMIGPEIDETMLDRLARAVTSYGRNRFLFVKKTLDVKMRFTVEQAKPGFFIGHIDRFSTESEHEPFDHNYLGWEKLCRAAFASCGG
jgi:tetratricopeptide (TPR) repeat protein